MKFNGIESLSALEDDMVNLINSTQERIEEIEAGAYFIGKENFYFRETASGKTKLMRVIGKSKEGKRKNTYIPKNGHDEALKKIRLGDELQTLEKRASELNEIHTNYFHRLKIAHSDFQRFEKELTSKDL